MMTRRFLVEVALIGSRLITQRLLADSRPEMTTCWCRRDGKHLCTMASMAGDQVPAARPTVQLAALIIQSTKRLAVLVHNQFAT